MSGLKYIFILILSALMVAGCSEKPGLIVQAGAGEQTVTAKAGSTFTIEIKGRMSTGFSWKLAEVPASLQLVKEEVKTDGKDIAGAEDIQVFVLKAGTTGDYTLTFRYAEHWKKKPKYVKTTIVKVRVE